MSARTIPSTMHAWQFNSAASGLENNLTLNTSAPIPKRKPDQHLVQVLAASVNPVDHKLAEMPLFTRFFLSKPVIPAMDFAGRIIEPASGSSLEPGQLVFGQVATNIIGGAFAEYAIAKKSAVTPLPEGVSPAIGASVAVVGLTAYQTITPFVKEGSNIFINGGSGGTGCYGIQIAKAKGCHVTTTCSTANIELCKSLGADEVIDYKTQNVFDELVKSGRKFDHVVDNIGYDTSLFWKCDQFVKPGALWIGVGAPATIKAISDIAKRILVPRFLGGAQRKFSFFGMVMKADQLSQIGGWLAKGEVKAIIDSQIPFKDAPEAYRKLKTSRAKGKIVVNVAE